MVVIIAMQEATTANLQHRSVRSSLQIRFNSVDPMTSESSSVRIQGFFTVESGIWGPAWASALQNSEVSTFQGPLMYYFIGNFIRDLAYCPCYSECTLFSGVRKAGFHCIIKGAFTLNPLLVHIESPSMPKRIGSKLNAHRERSHVAN